MIHSINVAARRFSSSGVRERKNQSNLNHISVQSTPPTHLNRGHSPTSRLINS
jgi:hypothetical protein